MEQTINSQNCIANGLRDKQEMVLAEISVVSPYLNLLHQQLAGALKDTEEHIVSIMRCLGGISQISIDHKNRINGALLNETIQANDVDGHSCQNKELNAVNSRQTPSIENNSMLELILELSNGNEAIINQITEALGHLQFQDVLRQRLEQVQSAIFELNKHFLGLENYLEETGQNGGKLSPTLKQRMESHFDQYVMDSQRDAYESVMGDLKKKNGDNFK